MNKIQTSLNDNSKIEGYQVTAINNGRFSIVKSIGKGSFGEIYQGYDNHFNRDVAIKMEHRNCKVKVLQTEARILKSLSGLEGFPKYYWFGQEHNQNILIMELLGPNFNTLLKQCGGRFSLLTVLKIVDQILTRIEQMHNAGFIHRDIKPNNFVMGQQGTPQQDTIYLIDFGLSKPYKDMKRGVHYPQLPPGKSLTGTARYASINSHQGMTLSRRDDLESIAYMIIQFLRGNLPWQGVKGMNKLEKYSNILDVKLQTIEEILCRDLPNQFCKFLKYSKDIEYDEKPDYKRLKHEFRVLFYELQSDNSRFMFDWQLRKALKDQNKGSRSSSQLIQSQAMHLSQQKQKQANDDCNKDNKSNQERIKQQRAVIYNSNQGGPSNDRESEVRIPILSNNFEGLPEEEKQDKPNPNLYSFQQLKSIDITDCEDPTVNKMRSFDINITSFTLNPNKKVNSREFYLTSKGEITRIQKLKSIYPHSYLLPNFMYQNSKKLCNSNSNSHSSIEPILCEEMQQDDVSSLDYKQNISLNVTSQQAHSNTPQNKSSKKIRSQF